MQVENVSPAQTAELLEQGAVYVDVRSEPEFEAGHVPGSFNVPLLHAGPAGLVPNPEFLAVMQQAFGLSEKLVIGCRSGQRSLKAAELLLCAGYSDVVNLAPGFEGTKDAFGRKVPGWRLENRPVEIGPTPGYCYRDTRNRKPG